MAFCQHNDELVNVWTCQKYFTVQYTWIYKDMKYSTHLLPAIYVINLSFLSYYIMSISFWGKCSATYNNAKCNNWSGLNKFLVSLYFDYNMYYDFVQTIFQDCSLTFYVNRHNYLPLDRNIFLKRVYIKPKHLWSCVQVYYVFRILEIAMCVPPN